MGQVVFILGRSGTGKSYSLRNFPPEKVALINVQGKILPFRGAAKIESTVVDQSDKIVKALEIYGKSYKSIVIDDYQYVMGNEFMRRSAERGYDKFTEIGRHAWDIVNTVRNLPENVIVYIMCHIERDDEGNEKIKTIGKLLDEKICLEGMSTIVLKTNVSDGQYSFLTQNNGRDTTKSPHEMFPSYAVENDLYYVDQKIRNYYGFDGSLTDEEMAEIDEAAKKEDIPIDDGKKKRGRRSAKKEEPTETSAEEEKAETRTEEKGSRRRRTEENMNNDNIHVESAPNDADKEVAHCRESSDEVSTGRKRRARKSDKTREEVMEENSEKVANAGLEEAGENEEVPFDEVETPKTDRVPHRSRKDRSSEESVMNPPEETTTQEEAAPAGRRRRRRG